MRGILALALLGACGEGANKKGDGTVSVAAYAGLSEDRSWTFRDDDSLEPPEEDQLIRARADGEGGIELRRGATWGDGQEAGSMLFDEEAGLAILAWDLDATAGEGRYPFAAPTPANGDQQVAQDGWDCVAQVPATIETWYGTFEAALAFDCQGGGGPTGRWAFGEGVGLVRFAPTEGPPLDLVAPF